MSAPGSWPARAGSPELVGAPCRQTSVARSDAGLPPSGSARPNCGNKHRFIQTAGITHKRFIGVASNDVLTRIPPRKQPKMFCFVISSDKDLLT